MQIAFLLHETE